MGGGLPLRLWYLQGWVRSSSAQSSRPEWPAFSSAPHFASPELSRRGAPAMERAFCVPCASPGRMDLGDMSTPPYPSKPPLFFPEPTTLRPTLCADKNAPFHRRRPQYIFHPPGTASPSCRSSPFQPNGISSP